MKNHLFAFLTALVLGIVATHAQNNDGNNFNSYYVNHYENEIPPTPSAANFLQYGNTPVNISRGLPNISIPIYTLEVDGIQIPISLSYDASGVKVDDISSTVGMKWTLNAGGGVYRTVKDLDDFGLSFSWIRGTTNQPRFEEWWDNIQPDAQWFEDYNNNQYAIGNHISSWDQWPDNFRYNFLGYSGEFKFSPNGTLVKGVNDAITLKPKNVDDPNLLDSYFTANDQSGNYFIFSNNMNNKDINHTKYRTTLDYDPFLTDYVEADSHIVGWLLDYIETKNGKQIEIEYENTQNGPPDIYFFPYEINPISEQLQKVRGCGPCGDGPIPWDCNLEQDSPSYYYYYRTGTMMKYNPSSSLIKEIRSDNVDIEFLYLENDLVINGVTKVISGWKKRVSTIIITDKIEGKSKKFHFKYGVFSGDQRLKLTEIREEGFDGEFKPPYKFTYDEDNPLPSLGSRSKDYMGYYNGKNNSSLIPKTEINLQALTQQYVHNSNRNYVLLGDRYFDADYLSTGVLTQIEYPTGGKTEFSYEVNALGVNPNEPLIKFREKVISNDDFENINPVNGHSYDPFNKYIYSQLVEINNVVGKFQLTMLADCPDCDPSNGEVPKVKIYKYNGSLNDDPSDYFNTGNIGAGPVLSTSIVTNNAPNLISFDSSNGNGLYIVMLLLGGDPYVSNYDPETFDVRVSYSWNEKESDSNGNVVFQENYFGGLRIKEIKDFDEDNVVYNHKKYNYNQFYQDEGFGFKYNNYTKSYGSGGPFFIFSEIVETVPQLPLVSGYCYTDIDTEIIGSGNPQVINEKFRENRVFNSISDGLPLKKSIFDNTGQLLEFNEFLYRNESTTPVLDFYTPSEKIFPISYTFLCSIYQGTIKTSSGYSENRIRNRFFSSDNLISTKKSTQLFKSGSTFKPVTTIESYEYNNNRLMKREITDTRYTAVMTGDQVTGYNLDNPDGEIMQVDYKYVDDPSINPPLTSLPDGLPISKEVFDLKDFNTSNDDLKILGQYFEYDGYGNIQRTYRYNKGGGTHSGGPTYVPADYELDFSYLTDQGKPTQVAGQDGLITSYIWGYNKQYPVAKIVGLSYAIAIATPGFNLAVATTSSNAQAIQDEINKIRVAYPSAQITTYTYKPMVGVNSIIDPKGLKATYYYDGFGRLEYVKDQQGNVLSKNEYHYKN